MYWQPELSNYTHVVTVRTRQHTLLRMSRPTPQDVVKMLMTQSTSVYRDVTTKRKGLLQNVLHLAYECPRKDECKKDGKVVFEAGTGLSNPYKHLRYCLCDGVDKDLLDLYGRCRDEKRNFNGSSTKQLLTGTTK